MTNIEVKHPSSGGRLQVEGSGKFRIEVTLIAHYFSIFGKLFVTLFGREGMM
ncbi:MAG: hypothetical protein P8M25_01625 [Paracoccaceae bacterium]|jgi:hypothetical protein|nr:hypothetical protein [Paracoccaceae bacterium]